MSKADPQTTKRFVLNDKGVAMSVEDIPQTTEQYGISILNKMVPIKYGRTWWQFWKPWKVSYITPLEAQKIINREMEICLRNQ